MPDAILARFRKLAPTDCEFSAIRVVATQTEFLSISRGTLRPLSQSSDLGLMITLFHQGQFAYAATCDCSEAGIKQAIDRAKHWLQHTQGKGIDYGNYTPEHNRGEYHSPVESAWSGITITDKIALLQDIQQSLSGHEAIVDWQASLGQIKTSTAYATNGGGDIRQSYTQIFPSMTVAANKNGLTLQRSLGGDYSRQGGLETLAHIGFKQKAAQLKEEVLQLLDAPNCPSQTADLILMPNQMMLQIHESIGHPLELDRILGDERNYAGTSFVDLDMFGTYQYGSPLLNVSFDPTISNQLASYAFDDDGQKAEKVMVIEKGLLKQPLGGAFSRARTVGSQITGTANARSTNWNRPALDRMANLNLEPSDSPSSLDDIIAHTENGVLMDTNCSWSIDDSRNKFQFGCELGRVIKDGELKHMVRNPNYRGISATFWRNLAEVGDQSTFNVLGTPNCGKAEPNQVIRVGHASPVCRFNNVAIFGGES